MPLRTALIPFAAAAILAGASAGAAVPVPLAPAAPAGEAPARAAGAPPATSGPRAIPLEHVFREADELEAPLRRAEALAQPDPDVELLERRLATVETAAQGLRSDVEAQRLLDASAREIDRMRQAVVREDLLLAEDQALLDKRAGALADGTRELQERLASWRLTSEAARAQQAPPAVLRRVTQVEEALRVEEGRLRARQDRVLGLQARVSDLRGELARLAAAVDDADAIVKKQLFEVESAPLWRALVAPSQAGALGAQIRQAIRESGRDVALFVRDEQGRLWLHLAIVVGLGLGLVALRRPIQAMEAGDPALRGATRALSRPWSAALLLSLPATGGLYPPLAPALRDLFFLAFLAPVLRVLPGLVPDRLRRPLYGLAALFALDKLASLAPPRTLLARLAVLAVTAAALGGLLSGLRAGRWARLVGTGAWRTATRGAGVVAAGLLSVSVLSNVVGNATLAERLTRATLTSAALGVVLVGVQVVLESALAALLHVPVVHRRPLVARHHDLVHRRTTGLLRFLLVLTWAARTAKELGVSDALAAAGGAILDLRVRVGGLDVSLGDVSAFAITLAVSLWLARAVRFVLDEGVFAEVQLPRGVPTAISTSVQYVLVVLGFFWAVLASGMEMSRFSFLVGALGVGIGFGLQNVVNNLVSGLILLYERPVQIRDVVEVGSVAGEVTRIGVRSSTVRTFAGAEVIVPNATLISAEVTNWTLSDRRRRIELAVGVAYGTPPPQVIDLLLATVRGRPGVLQDPAPVALFLRFGESSLDFALRFWTADFDTWQVLASDVLIEVHARLGRAGIEIPFPQRDLHVRSLDRAVTEALAAPREPRDPLGGKNVALPRPPDAKP
jgi:small-conductance mechanosensitive channel